MTEEYLLLDSSIRDWVVLPIVLILIIVGLGRHYVQELIKSSPKVKASDLDEMRIKQTLMQAARLRTHGQYINEKSYNMRKSNLIRVKTGILREKVPGPTNPMSNPMAMVDMMKGNLIFMLPNIALMAFVGYFFSGFLCLKLPFSVPSNHFRSMLQRGVDLTSLDISYVSSLSWYFLVTFGLNGVLGLLLGDSSASEQMMQMQMMGGMGMMGGGAQPGFDAKSAYQQEREALSATRYDSEIDRVERRLLGDRYPDPSAPAIDFANLNLGGISS